MFYYSGLKSTAKRSTDNLFNPWIFIFIFFLSSLSVSGQDRWTTVKRKNGIEVQTKDAPGWPLKAYRAWVKFNGSQKDVYDYMIQWSKHTEWLSTLEESKLMHKGEDEYIVYYKYNNTWPVEDRDLISKFVVTTEKDGTIYMHFTALPNYAPRKKDNIRIEKTFGYWRLRQVDENTVEIAIEAKSTTGGELPTNVANMMVESNPYKTLKSLKEHFTMPGE